MCLPSRGGVPACGPRLRPLASAPPGGPSADNKTLYFLELFAGAGGLTAAVRRLGIPAFEPHDLLKPDESGLEKAYDLCNPAHFNELRATIRRGEIRWLHGGPPCKTFSRARRSDKFAKARILRSDRFPEGLKPRPYKVIEANLLASRMARLARCIYKAGGWFSIENPEESLMWKFAPLASLAKLEGVELFKGDQCALGGIYKKPTGWLSNAPWFSVVCKRCPPEHPVHPPLVGFAETSDGKKVWLTELAAEYSEGLCDSLASAYRDALRTAPQNSAPKRNIIEMEGPTHTTEGPTKRVRKDIEADNCVGGLRNPLAGLRHIPKSAEVGALVLSVLKPFISRHWSALLPVIHSLGSDSPVEPSEEHVIELRDRLASALEISVPQSVLKSEGLQPWLFRALLERSGDPECEVPVWLESYTPLGIVEPIKPASVFPGCDPRCVGPELAKLKVNPLLGTDGFENYTSYTANRAEADQAMQRELDRGYAEAGTVEELTRKYGHLVLSRIACIISEKEGKQKVRLIHDLRRSAVNARILLSERLVLPRISDVVTATLDLMEQGFSADQLCFLVADFRDAFKMLRTFPSERRFLSGKALGAYFVFTTVLFGVGTGPLVWCRVAAAMMRITQAALSDARLCCFIDDPITIAAGTEDARLATSLSALLLWCAMGAGISWDKACYSSSVTWIGAQFSFGHELWAVTVSLPPRKVEALLCEITAIKSIKKGMVQRERLRALAGLGAWIGGMAPQVKPFVRQIWAAITSKNKNGKIPKLVYLKQISSALKWLELFCRGAQGGLAKTFRLEERFADGLVFVCDASLWGGGAACWPNASQYYANAPPCKYLAVQWSTFHEDILGAKIGDPAHQATFEAYTFLLAISSWVDESTRGRLVLVGDALGVMHGMVQWSAKSRVVNEISKEIALVLAPLCLSLKGIHIWGEENDLADALSRLYAGKDFPLILASVPRTQPKEQWLSLGT